MAQIKVDYNAFRIAAVTAQDVFMAFCRPYNIYLDRSRTHSDKECSHCLGEARDLLRKLEKAAGVTIVDHDLSLEDMGTVCTIIDHEAQKLALAREAK